MKKRKRSKPPATKTKSQLPTQKNENAILESVTEIFSGPIPDPQTLSRYGEIDPSFPSRILTMAEDQGTHRRTMEKRQVNHGIAFQYLGRVIGFFCVLIVCSVGTYALHLGHDEAGKWIIITTSVGLAGLFVTGKYRATPSKNTQQ